jgi:hypothetical protein
MIPELQVIALAVSIALFAATVLLLALRQVNLEAELDLIKRTFAPVSPGGEGGGEEAVAAVLADDVSEHAALQRRQDRPRCGGCGLLMDDGHRCPHEDPDPLEWTRGTLEGVRW